LWALLFRRRGGERTGERTNGEAATAATVIAFVAFAHWPPAQLLCCVFVCLPVRCRRSSDVEFVDEVRTIPCRGLRRGVCGVRGVVVGGVILFCADVVVVVVVFFFFFADAAAVAVGYVSACHCKMAVLFISRLL